jgi:hypothetical protein
MPTSELDFSDFTLTILGENEKKISFQAHGFILAARSPYFSANFRSGMKEVETREIILRVGDFSPSKGTVEKFLEFLYTGEKKRKKISFSKKNRLHQPKSSRMH